MRVTSNRALARQLGVSETAVRRAEKAGRIKREPDGSWDPHKLHTVLERHVRDHLAELAEVRPTLR
jgi:hypothetical protein